MPAFFDVYSEFHVNTEFRNKLNRYCTGMQKAAKAGDKEATAHFMISVLDICHGNPGLLVPVFWPRYPEAKPMSLWGRPHSFGMMSFIPNGSLVVQAGRQVGKCLSPNTKLVMRKSDGNVYEEDILSVFMTAKEDCQRGGSKTSVTCNSPSGVYVSAHPAV